MVNGVKIKLIYHLYLKNVESINNNIYYEINRRCLKYFHDIFDSALFCVSVDDTGNAELVQKGIEWILSCGFKNNVEIKIKQNTAFCDAQTFYDEIVDKLSDFKEMVFFAHNKGCGNFYDNESVKQWVIFSYYASLHNINDKILNLTEQAISQGYIPLYSDNFKITTPYKWILPGSIFLFNPMKIANYLKENEKEPPILQDRFSGEMFLSKIFDIMREPYSMTDICFENYRNGYFKSDFANYYEINHYDLLAYFLPKERIENYKNFYNEIINNI